MISKYLKLSNNSIQELIELTSKDIEDIKEAKHTKIHDRSFEKSKIIEKFEKYKSQLDMKLVEEAKDNKSIGDVLTKEESDLLGTFRENLKILQQKNKNFAKLVVAVNEFYNSMISEMFPDKNGTTNENYGMKKVSPASLLEVNA